MMTKGMQNLMVIIKKESEVDLEKSFILNLKENIYMEKEMEKEKNIIGVVV